MIKRLLRSKAFWIGLSSIASGIAAIIEDKLEIGVSLIVTGASTIALRDAIAKNARTNK